MSTTAPAPITLDLSGTPRVPMSRLVKVELRKMVDTRSGFWLLLITGILLVLAMAITLLVGALDDSADLTAAAFSEIMTIPVSLLIPVFAVLIVTSEWSQRSHLVTFTAEPDRFRVVVAKLVAVCTVAVSTILLAAVLGAAGNLLFGVVSGNDVVWDVSAGDLVGLLAVQVLFFLMGFGLAMLILNTPGAVAIFYLVGFLLPVMVYSSLYFVFEWAPDVIPWFDLTSATLPWVSDTDYRGDRFDVGAREWAQAASATFLWVVAPIGLGVRRVLRSEVK